MAYAQPRDRAADLGRLYTRLAPIYGLWGDLTETRARERALALADLRGGESVLEVAIGTGAFLARLAEIPGLRRVCGLDLAEGMIRRARRVLGSDGKGRAGVCRADARRLPFTRGAFDVLFNCYMLDLLAEEEIPPVLVEFRQVLRPSGRLVVLVMAPQAKVFNALWMALHSISPSLVGGCRPVPIGEFLISGGWQVDGHERIAQCGFRSELLLARPVR